MDFKGIEVWLKFSDAAQVKLAIVRLNQQAEKLFLDPSRKHLRSKGLENNSKRERPESASEQKL